MESYREKFYKYQSIARGGTNIETVKSNFDKMISSYEVLFGDILKSINVSDKILDLGCGMGNLCYFLVNKGFKNVKGVDFDRFSVDIANQLGLNVIEDEVLHFLKEETGEKYNVIFALDLLEHLNKNEAITLLELIYEKLDEEGMLILKTPCADSFYGARHIFNDITHEWGMTSGVLQLLLEMVGFKKVEFLDESLVFLNANNILKKIWKTIVKVNRSLFCKMLHIPEPFWSSSIYTIGYKKG